MPGNYFASVTVFSRASHLFIFSIMLNTEKKTSKQTQRALLAIANFMEDASISSMYQTLHKDFQEFFNTLMLTDDADDAEFREKAMLMLQFTKYFSESFADVEWQEADEAARLLKDDVSLKIIGHE